MNKLVDFRRISFSVVITTILLTQLAQATTVTTTEVTSMPMQSSKTNNSVVNNAQDWGLSDNEWQTYQKLMAGAAGKWYPQLTPAEVLGMLAENEQDQQHFAEIAAKEQHEKIVREIAFNNAFHQAMHKLYTNEPVIKSFDMSAFNPITLSNKKSI